MEILGSIISIKDLMGNKDTTLKFSQGNTKKIKKETMLNIPFYQREIRWTEENVLKLIDDLINKPIFLGNIIVSYSTTKLDIIDGQQRLTVLYMLLKNLMYLYKGKVANIFDLRCLFIESFENFEDFINGLLKNDSSRYDADKDFLYQSDKYKLLIDTIINHPKIKHKEDAKKIIDNIEASKINIVISNETNIRENIGYFIDVNVKSVTLDNEDIFKGIMLLNSGDEHEKNLKIWYKIKKGFNSLKSIPSFNKNSLTLMDIVEHYYRWYIVENLPKLTFKSSLFTIGIFDDGNNKYAQNTHILDIVDTDKITINLEEISDYIEFLKLIINSTGPTPVGFTDVLKNKDLHPTEINIIYHLLKHIVLMNDKIFKLLILKYFFDYFKSPKSKKEDIQSIYSLFLFSNITSIQKNRKSTSSVISYLNAKNFESELIEESMNEIKDITIKTKISARAMVDIDNTDNLLAKSIAIFYNFFSIEKNNDLLNIKVKNKESLLNYIATSKSSSIEHFIINDSEKYVLNGETLKYKKDIIKFKNSLINFLFIPASINSEELANKNLDSKVTILKSRIKEITCSFSAKYLSEISNALDEYKIKYPLKAIDDNIELIELVLDKYKNIVKHVFLIS